MTTENVPTDFLKGFINDKFTIIGNGNSEYKLLKVVDGFLEYEDPNGTENSSKVEKYYVHYTQVILTRKKSGENTL